MERKKAIPHYEARAKEIPNRKSLTATANHVEAVENGAVDQLYFSQRYVRDVNHSLAYFRRVVYHFCGSNVEGGIRKLEQALLATEKDRKGPSNSMHHFTDEAMFSVLMSNPTCKRACEFRKINSWQEIIALID